MPKKTNTRKPMLFLYSTLFGYFIGCAAFWLYRIWEIAFYLANAAAYDSFDGEKTNSIVSGVASLVILSTMMLFTSGVWLFIAYKNIITSKIH